MTAVSFVIPCFRSAETVRDVVEQIRNTIRQREEYTYEIILVNDSSPDHTYEVIKELCQEDKNIVGIHFSKNFGQHSALMAGMREVKGDIVVCLDDDGQTPADEMFRLLDQIQAGYDVVYAKYDHKKHSFFRNLGSRVNDIMTRWLLGKPKNLFISSYFAAKRFVIDEVIQYRNSYPYVIGLVLRTTNKITNVEVTHKERTVGASGYSMKKLIALWTNGFTSFSVKPLRIATFIGTVCAIGGFLFGAYTIIRKLLNPEIVLMGWSSTIAILLFVGGMIMLLLGMIGEYIGRIYISINNSPQYVIREKDRYQEDVHAEDE